MSALAGQTVSHYHIREKLGEGGMGVVYRARDTRLDRDVALKFLPHCLTSDPTEKERFSHEARAASSLVHPNIAVVFEINEPDLPASSGQAGGQMFIAMEYVEGRTLKEIIREETPSVKKVLDIAIQVCDGLAAAHEKGIVHRDIKSDNIMLTPKGQPKIMDFGLAKLRGATRLTSAGSTLGTAAYMSPEQARGEDVDHRSDIFSFGVVLYELLTGNLPFRGEHQAAVMYSIMNDEPALIARFNATAGDDLQHIVGKALAKDREDRYQHVDDLQADLRRERKSLDYAREGSVATSQRGEAKVRGETAAPAKPGRRAARFLKPATLILAAVVLLAILRPFNFEIGPTETDALDRKSVAVLPFTNMSGSRDDEFFSDGVTEDIIAQLSTIGDLKVISRTSTMQYKNTSKNLREIARELRVATVLEGSVRRADNQVRIVAQLIDAANDRHLWARTYDKELTQIFAIQSDVARQIASALMAELSEREKDQLAKQPTGNIDAYAYYLKGREYYCRYTRKDNENAIQLFTKALGLDPDYALAYAGLGDAYCQRASRFGLPRSWIDSSIAVSTKAISLDPTSAEAYKALGLGYQNKGWLKRSLETYHKAVELNPNYDPAVANIGFVNGMLGNIDEAWRWQKRSLRLNPMLPFTYVGAASVFLYLGDHAKSSEWLTKALALQPDLGPALQWLAWVALAQGDHRKCIELASRILSSDPDDISALILLGWAEVKSGNVPRAEVRFTRAVAIDPSQRTLIGPAYVYWHTGRREQARAMFARSLELGKAELARGNEEPSVLYDMALVNAIQNNKAEACDWLQKAIEAGWRTYWFADLDPRLENLRGEHRFKKMMADLRGRTEEMQKRIAGMEQE